MENVQVWTNKPYLCLVCLKKAKLEPTCTYIIEELVKFKLVSFVINDLLLGLHYKENGNYRRTWIDGTISLGIDTLIPTKRATLCIFMNNDENSQSVFLGPLLMNISWVYILSIVTLLARKFGALNFLTVLVRGFRRYRLYFDLVHDAKEVVQNLPLGWYVPPSVKWPKNGVGFFLARSIFANGKFTTV